MGKDFQVKIIGVTENPQLLSTAGALGCFEEKSSDGLIGDLSALPAEERAKKERAVLKNSFGRGHGSVGDQNCFVFSIENLPRAATLQLCQPQYLAHLQQSLRRAKASRGFHLPEIIVNSAYGKKAEEILSASFRLYEKMSKAGIPDEDARYILPLYTRTNIQTLGNARELCHLWKMTHSPKVEAPSIVMAVVDEMIAQASNLAPYLFEDFRFNHETLAWYPSAQIYASHNETMEELIRERSGMGEKMSEPVFLSNDRGYFRYLTISEERIERAIKEKDEAELANLKHIHFEFLASMSLACFHQAIRQRTWDQSVQPIYDALPRYVLDGFHDNMLVPLSIKSSDLLNLYREQHLNMLNLYKFLKNSGIPRSEAIGVIPHSVRVYDWIHINGWNALHSIGKRTCVEAQGEIMRIARQMADCIKKEIPAIGRWSEPQCITYGYCPEIRDCGYYKKKKI
ncbi:MAG: FAD-dependent thymidylate synthase [bacterium]|nr:FAD-dependent thymidylate synthase [bacterium]